MNKEKLIFDLSSARAFDADGRMHVQSTNISKANVCEYWGREIPGHEQLGLDANKIYRMYRHPDALRAACDTFARQPLLMGHHDADADNPHKDKVIGAVGSNVAFDGTYLTADISVWDSAAIAAIESGQVRELSCAYRYTPIMTPGTSAVGAYDGIMLDIVGSHLALVEEGRAGRDVRVADENLDGGSAMDDDVVVAAPETLPDGAAPDVGAVAPEPDAVAEPTLTDEDLDAEPTLTDEDLDAVPELPDAEPEVLDEDPLEAAKDELRAEFRAANVARAKCRAVVGDALNCDTAEDIYRLALDTLGVRHDAIYGHAALEQMFDAVAGTRDRAAASAAKTAQDGAMRAGKMFPALDRFSKL